MFDTHCHLNFQAFDGRVDEIVDNAREAGVTHIVVPGTDLPTSQKAVTVAKSHKQVYAAVGIHPHHVFESQQKGEEADKNDIVEIEELLKEPCVVAVGEVGLDRHYYTKTRHENYNITEEFVKAQCTIFADHMKLALKHKKSLIIHHREAKEDILRVLAEVWDASLARKSVIHCCEPDRDLLRFAQKNNLFIGVDGDVTYDRKKQEFIKEVPIEMLVLETDAPFLIPEPYRSMPRDTRGPNVPAHLPLIAQRVAQLKGYDVDEVKKITFENGIELFQLR
ncbi:TatD family hydrolase [Candidatus Microgenomates bacterium]|nr:TatD family hydrolase [Candidatus Microgenomates bacterium]